jgi:uncharacterized membrane protein
MTLLALGLALFIAPHLLPTIPSLRQALFARAGEERYRGLFSLVTLVGLVLIVVGFRDAPRDQVFPRFLPAVAMAKGANTVALILFAAANMKGHIRRAVQHPMLLGLLLWSVVHVLANGDRRGTVLFGALAGSAVVDLASAIRRRAVKSFVPEAKHDVRAVVGGVVVALVVMTFHRVLFGPQVVSFGM